MRLSPIRLALKTQSLEEWFWRLVFVGVCCDFLYLGMVYCEVATRTLDTASPVTRRGRREEKSREEAQPCHGHKTLPPRRPDSSAAIPSIFLT